ncbi:hypothetical protein AVEN_230560-1 [Araneus ventricosus]|uniref:Uncharacterized protein n=1 Tax=Araneus ventricosus TaxID=182803 RepID=A0A4Y2GJ01_ARAVE|nr:hypothetical protein AVEN_230560-1 [Araneus ventricosus]
MLKFVTKVKLLLTKYSMIYQSQNKAKARNICRTCDRYAVADRPAVALASALLHDLSHSSTSLANKNPGKLSHVRWLTTANRLLRLYISIREPSEKFKEISRFIMKVYSPMWFYIKCHPTIMKAPVHLHRTISFSG